MRSVLSFFVSFLGVAFAVPSPRSDHVVHEFHETEPTHWRKAGRLDSNKVLPMGFGLVQQNLHRLEEMLMSVSHPESPNYAQHFTPMEVINTFAPSEETISAVTSWLVDSGFSRDRLRLSASKGWIHLNASTSEVENLLNTECHVYTHPSGDTQTGEECPYIHWHPKTINSIYGFQGATTILCQDIYNSTSISSNLVLYTSITDQPQMLCESALEAWVTPVPPVPLRQAALSMWRRSHPDP
jgi:subtilase family serine protease